MASGGSTTNAPVNSASIPWRSFRSSSSAAPQYKYSPGMVALNLTCFSPGVEKQVRFKATMPGLYLYWGAAEVDDLKLRHGIDAELTGAFVVDPPEAIANDEIFVIEMISERPGLANETLATINGKSWPYTQRFEYNVGQPVRWRWINATNEPHALHLHG